MPDNKVIEHLKKAAEAVKKMQEAAKLTKADIDRERTASQSE